MAIQIDEEPLLSLVWGKTDPYHPLVYHLIDVGNVIQALLAEGIFQGLIPKVIASMKLDRDNVIQWMGYFGAMHDIGKCSGDFQAKAGYEFAQPLLDAGMVVPDTPRLEFRHEGLSGDWIATYLQERFGWTPAAATVIACVFRGHHGTFNLPEEEEHPAVEKSWNPIRFEIARLLESLYSLPEWRASMFKDASVSGAILAGLVVVCDWIASNEKLFQYPSIQKAGNIVDYAAASKGLASAIVSKLQFDGLIDWTICPGFRDVWMSDDFKVMRPLQATFEQLLQGECEIEPGLAIIEAPMGEGKTEAAVYLATRWLVASGLGGIYFALPTTATSNQMHGRIEELLESHSFRGKVRLVHGTAWMVDDATPDMDMSDMGGEAASDTPDITEALIAATNWFRPTRRAMLAPYGVGTIDQVLMSVLRVKFGQLRMLGIANKILIIDEIHAYDPYMTHILERLLAWASSLGVPVIALSATLPANRKEALVQAYCDNNANIPQFDRETAINTPYPLITLATRSGAYLPVAVDGVSRSMAISLIREKGCLGDTEAVARLAVAASVGGGCICVIANTVVSAQAIYPKVLEKVKEDEWTRADYCTYTRLFHSRFLAKDRKCIEDEVVAAFDKRSLLEPANPKWKERPARAIIVATQVVEQSLDIDFDELISELAPIDLLLQRIGRMHRHERGTRPTGTEARLHVLLPAQGSTEFGKSKKVYSTYVLLKTMLAIKDLDTIQLPADIRSLVETVYATDLTADAIAYPEHAKALQEAWKKVDEKRVVDEHDADKYLIKPPSSVDFSMASQSSATFNEDDEGMTRYFTAKTRNDDDTERVLIIKSGQFTRELDRKKAPKRDIIKEMVRFGASIPRWWIAGVKPAKGYTKIHPAPWWVGGYHILEMREGSWKGYTDKKKLRLIVYDPILGLYCKDGGK